MATERTLSIIKPDAVAANLIGAIYHKFEEAGLRIVASRMRHLSTEEAEQFYLEHAERPFYGELVGFMTSGPVMVQVLEGDDAIANHRKLMGATKPSEADPGTIRHSYARNSADPSANAVHGSDSAESAAREIPFFFNEDELCPRG